MTHNPIEDTTNLQAYFFEEIERAQARSGRDLSDEVEVYVVGLMARFLRRTEVAGRTAPPLATQFLDARSQQGAARRYALREVGDRALYIAGVVPRVLDRRGLGVHYADAIGRAAYGEVASRSGPLSVFRELADHFGVVAAVMGAAVDHATGGDVPEDLLAVYERYRTHGHDVDLARLVRAGVTIRDDDTQLH